jgi:hypothetical protein
MKSARFSPVPKFIHFRFRACTFMSSDANSFFNSPERASQRRMPEEKGPFGRATNRRGVSRSKTFTPSGTAKKEDKDAQESWKVIDEIFQRAKESSATAEKQQSTDPSAAPAVTTAGTPTEVILYGFPEPYQWSAIEFYERVSMGVIYEDYERAPPNPRYNQTLSQSARVRKSKLPSEALKKVNKYHGGVHWIKVTFDSAEAADRACHASPHKLNGYLVYAERYRGTGPNTDAAIPATDEAIRGISASPSQNSTTSSTIRSHITAKSSSTLTASSATANQESLLSASSPTITIPTPSGSSTATSTALLSPGKKPLLRGAKRVVLLPAEKAVLPATSRWQRTFGGWPLIGFFFGGSQNDMIGNQVPLKDNGEFDWDHASLYWKFWAWLDFYIFFANFLGLKGDD